MDSKIVFVALVIVSAFVFGFFKVGRQTGKR